ncbi:MAG: LacI family transcriptional regulator [Cypionkella sp.]|jgi:LacI family transcriptional regulator|nr:LacI family transcriptional regulator [Cypionkella sp.]
MATIYDVAKAAGVAPSTVSRHINGLGVRQPEAIERAIQDLGFRASASARNLRKGNTQVVAMIVPDIQNPYYAATVAGAEQIGRMNGLRLVLCNTDEDLDLEDAVLQDIIGRVDGAILVPASERSSTKLFEAPGAIPLVLMDRETLGRCRFDTVTIENHRGGALAAEHLLSLGHRDVALITGPITASQSRARETAFLEVFAKAGVPIPDRFVVRGDFREAGGYQAALDILTIRRRPTALFVVNNMMSIGALRAIKDLQISLPQDLSLVCFDQLPCEGVISPRPTTIRRAMEEQGAMAMRLMLNRLRAKTEAEEDEHEPRTLILPVELVVGASTARLGDAPRVDLTTDLDTTV